MALSQSTAANVKEDILVQIFLILSKSYDSTSGGKRKEGDWDWTYVMEVCRYWSIVAKGTPSLWSYIYPKILANTYQTNRYLLLSKNSDLTVIFGRDSMSGDEDGTKNLMTVLKEMSRVRHIPISIVAYGKEDTKLLALLDQPAPRVESISLMLPDVYGDRHLYFPINTPGTLRRVHLSIISLRLDLSRFSKLTTLDIFVCQKISLLELFAVFERSPELSSISLGLCNFNPSLLIPKQVILPRLLYMKLMGISTSDCCNIYAGIEAPNLLYLDVKFHKQLGLDDLPKLDKLSKLLTMKCNIDTLKISMPHSRSIEVDVASQVPDDGEAHLSLEFDQINLDALILQLMDIFRSHLQNATKFVLVNPIESVEVETWRRVFSASISAQFVHILVENKPGEDNQTNCIEALGLACPVDSGEELPFPRVEQIALRWLSKRLDVDRLLFSLEEMARTRAKQRSAILKLSVTSQFVIPEDDEKLKALSRWVNELKWTNEIVVDKYDLNEPTIDLLPVLVDI